MKMIDIGDLVRVENFNVDDAEADPNGFVGIVSGATLHMDDEGDIENGEVTFDINLPVAWAKGKHDWTFKESELTLIEAEVV
jgi:hypothetical protein